MIKRKLTFTSESVTEGHPDKMADQISDAVLDAALNDDPNSRVACETMLTTGLVVVSGEITTSTYIDVPGLVREVVNQIGYNKAEYGFDSNTCGVISAINRQSPDIAMGVDTGGAGDQGLMFGFACDDTEDLMPAPIYYAHQLSRELSRLRKSGELGYLRPDGKTQVSVVYDGHDVVAIDTVVVSSQHAEEVKQEQIRSDIENKLIKKIIPSKLLSDKTNYYINPTGRFVIGGPMGDCGLTGRKIIVDTYGGMGRHGGGAFSGKDASKVDRSAAYAARYVAKNIVASGIASKAEVQLAYAIGVAQPVSINVNTFGTNQDLDEVKLEKVIKDMVDLSPKGIIARFDLKRPIFRATAAYGHFGRKEFPWEKTDIAKDIKSAF